MPVCSRISLNKVSCSKSPRSSWGPWRCVLGSTSPVRSKSFKYRLTERSETHNSCEIVDGDIFWAILSHTILHRKSTEYGRGIATALYTVVALRVFHYEIQICRVLCACARTFHWHVRRPDRTTNLKTAVCIWRYGDVASSRVLES